MRLLLRCVKCFFAYQVYCIFRCSKVYKNFIRLTCIVLLIFSSNACSNEDETVIVSYKSEKLTLGELRQHIPNGITKQDSTRYAHSYIEQWKMEQCLVAAATERVSDIDQKIEYKLRDYKRKMYINELHDFLIQNEPPPAVSDDDAEKYYKDNIQQFISGGNLYWYAYIRTKDNSVQNFMQKIATPNEHERADLIKWCQQNALEFKLDEVYEAPHVINHLSEKVNTDLTNFAPNQPAAMMITNEDGAIVYHLFYMHDIVRQGKYIPFASVKKEVKRIILLKKQHQQIEQFEAQIYEQAKSAKEFGDEK